MATVIADDHRLGAEPENEAPGGHHREDRRQRGDDRADHADDGERERREPGAEAVDDHPADQHDDDVRQAVDRVERADLRVGKTQQTLQ
jgi:hypothetical protein